jgi:hypothetical protein
VEGEIDTSTSYRELSVHFIPDGKVGDTFANCNDRPAEVVADLVRELGGVHEAKGAGSNLDICGVNARGVDFDEHISRGGNRRHRNIDDCVVFGSGVRWDSKRVHGGGEAGSGRHDD